MLSNQVIAVVTLSAFAFASTAFADAPKTPVAGLAGFYGGVSLRDAGTESQGLDVGQVASTWGRFASPVSDDSARRALVFGGYRFPNDIAVEGSITSAESYTLRPFDASMRRGVGLSLANGADLATHAWNADVYTSWSLRGRFSLYGRLGYAQSDAVPAYALAAMPMGDPRRLREGVNYGVGLRYDVTPALGLRFEYARFPRFAGEAAPGPLPDSDQVQFGVQLRF